jgi:hypothetical protein
MGPATSLFVVGFHLEAAAVARTQAFGGTFPTIAALAS